MSRGRRTALRRGLTPEDWELLQLTQRVRAATITPQMRLRARIVLLLAEGQTITAIAQQVNVARNIVYKWIKRWQDEGLRGLRDRKSGYPPGRSHRQHRG